MATWGAFEQEAPELAAFARERLAGRLAYLGTVRRDGAPRVNPVSPWIVGGGLFIRMYPGSAKVRSLERDPRYALHCSVEDADGGGGEVIVSGTARPVADPRRLAVANRDRSNPDRYVVFEFEVDDVLATTYEGGDEIRRRWPSA